MRIQYNGDAMNTIRNLGILNKNQAVFTARLSSGYKINCAADNAAGLKISEKMRAQIRGLNQASTNAQDGISFLQTADGALNEVHSILQRVRELSVQSANDTNVETDRQSIQDEVDSLLDEVNRIASSTELNTRKIFDGSLETSDASVLSPYKTYSLVSDDSSNIAETIENTSDAGSINIFYLDDSEYNFETTQTAGKIATASGYDALKDTLQNEIVPQAVNAILNTYSSAFGYLADSSIGIGLRLYTDATTSVLASCGTGVGGYYNTDGILNYDRQIYTLEVNMASLDMDADGNLDEDSRTELETTILHEFVHGFMYEALTNGMLGYANETKNTSNAYPLWFVEGMAQTASGGYANCNDWVNYALGITSSTSIEAIQDTVKGTNNSITNTTLKTDGSNAAFAYGTGYLACMYLGFLASGQTLNQENVTASNITSGLDYILAKLVSGSSLDSVVNEISDGTYTSISNFQTKFGDLDSATFISYLTQDVGEGNGSLATGSFSSTDLLPDAEADTTLFDLNTESTEVVNVYPTQVTVLSGGGTTTTGNKAVDTITEPTEPTVTEPSGDPTSVTTSIDVSSLTVGSGNGYTYDGTTLKITSNGSFSISGTKNGISIEVDDGLDVDMSIKNLNISSTTGSAISLGDGSNVTMKVSGTNTITSTQGAGIHVGEGESLTITGSGTLNVTAGTNTNAAAIGGNLGETAGSITINGDENEELVIRAKSGGNINGIGSGKDGTNKAALYQCGIVFQESWGFGTVYGKVSISDKLDTSGTSLYVDGGATLTVEKTGSIVNGSGNASIKNSGTILNWGSIGTSISSGDGGTVTHYITSITTQEPSDVEVGSTLAGSLDAICSVTYNGDQMADLTSTWKIKDKNGLEITDPSSVTVEEGDSFTYSIEYKIADDADYLFDINTSLTSSSIQSAFSTLGVNDSEEDSSVYDSVSAPTTKITSNGKSITFTYNVSTLGSSSGSGSESALTGGLHIQAGANARQSIQLDIGKIDTQELGIKDMQVMSYDESTESISLCDDAITKVSNIRSRIGAYQNRLEYTVSNLDNTSENLQQAESRIRDMDMASAMVDYSKNQILIQAAQAILAHANENQSGILALLQ